MATRARPPGETSFRVTNDPTGGGRVNPYFVELYRSGIGTGRMFQAAEHTAQVRYDKREERERLFGSAC